MISNYILVIVLTICLVLTITIHLGYVYTNRKRLIGINLAYLFSLLVTAINSVALKTPPGCADTDHPDAETGLLPEVAQSLTTYLQTWHATVVYMLAASHCPAIKIEMSVSHQKTFIDSMGLPAGYEFEVTIVAGGEHNTFPLIVSSTNMDKIAGKMLYHAQQLEQLVNDFMRNGKGMITV